MSEAAILYRAGALWGSDEAGLTSFPLNPGADLEEEILDLARKGFSLVAVTEDLLGGGEEKVAELLEKTSRQVSLVVIPTAGEGESPYLASLRKRFAVALGIDVWSALSGRGKD